MNNLLCRIAPLVAAVVALATPAAALQSPYRGTPFQLPTRIQAEDYDLGAEGEAYHDTTAGNAFGVYRGDSMDVGTIDTGGGHHIGALANGEWAEYTVNVPYTQQYEIRLRVSSASTGPNNFHLELNGVNVTGTQSVASTGGWHAYVIKIIPNVTLTAGSNKVLRIAFDTGAWNFDWMEIRGNTPYGSGPVSLPASRLQAENYDRGGEGVAWHDTTPGNAFGVYRPDDMDVGSIQDGSGGYHIGGLVAGEWAEYLVNVTAPGSYDLKLRYASAYTGTTRFRVLLDGVDLTGSQTITATGGWQTYTTKAVPVTVAAGNSKILRIVFEVGAWNLDWLELACTKPKITQHPEIKPADPGAVIELTGSASGTPALSYQWLKNGVPIAGATSSKLRLSNVEQGKDAGSYTLRASNCAGSVVTKAAVVRVTCHGAPAWLLENVYRALHDRTNISSPKGDYCDWVPNIGPNFPYSVGLDGKFKGTGGSYNLPVIAAATAFVKKPISTSGTKTWDMNKWWTDYLQGELGDRGAVWYYGGQELGSYNYQTYNIASVLAVHFHAHQVGNTKIRDLARRWLRATFALHALAAAPGPMATRHAKGQQRPAGTAYDGPYIAMAGMRSSWIPWNWSSRSILFSQAIGRVTNRVDEDPAQKKIREWVEPRWTGPNGNVYGLTASEQGELWTSVVQGTCPTNVVGRFLGAGLRTQVPYHIVAWPGVKVTLMERNTHNVKTPPTYGVAYFTSPRLAGGQEAHFLYPWQGLFIDDKKFLAGITHGWGRLDVENTQNRYIEASNEPGSTVHPLEPVPVRIDNLPLSRHSCWLVLGPNQAPVVQ